MANRLADELSPYLRQHADNPVDWYPWGEAAFHSARRLDRPIFLSVGYAACHWCHVMAHESFEDPAVAARLNAEFISVKVDREERPDVDAIYMDAVVALTGQGGWPMSVFLTPEGEPFFGGTYFPPQPRHGLPSFRDVIEGVARLWREDRPRLRQAARQLTEHLRAAAAVHTLDAVALAPATLDRACESLFRSYDWRHGGWGSAPKFPQALAIDFLLQRAARRGDVLARDVALHAVGAMAHGGLYDQLAGGFHRYSVDASWTIPHFEKMLYDNALLARTYLHAWQLSPSPESLRTYQRTMDFLMTEMRLPEGGFAASLDADTQGEEGLYYTWSADEIRASLPDPDRARAFMALHNVTESGNFDGRNVLTCSPNRESIARDLHLPPELLDAWDDEARSALLARRRERVPPARDDKVLTSWNGLVLILLAESARAFPTQGFLQAAQALADFLTSALCPGGNLMHVWRSGNPVVGGFLDDHAALGLGLLALHQTDGSARWLDTAGRLGDEVRERFIDSDGHGADVDRTDASLLLHPRTLQDSPTPSGGALAALFFGQLHAFTRDARYADLAQRMSSEIQALAADHPTTFAAWLSAIDLSLDPPAQLTILGTPDTPGYDELAQLVYPHYWPDVILTPSDSTASPPAAGRTMLEGRATALLCRDFVCTAPTNDPRVLQEQLAALRPSPRLTRPDKPSATQAERSDPPAT